MDSDTPCMIWVAASLARLGRAVYLPVIAWTDWPRTTELISAWTPFCASVSSPMFGTPTFKWSVFPDSFQIGKILLAAQRSLIRYEVLPADIVYRQVSKLTLDPTRAGLFP